MLSLKPQREEEEGMKIKLTVFHVPHIPCALGAGRFILRQCRLEVDQFGPLLLYSECLDLLFVWLGGISMQWKREMQSRGIDKFIVSVV